MSNIEGEWLVRYKVKMKILAQLLVLPPLLCDNTARELRPFDSLPHLSWPAADSFS